MAFQPQVTKVHLPRLAVNRCDPPRVVVSGIFSLAYLAELMFICMYINLFVYCLWHTQFFLNTILFGEDVGVIKCQFFFLFKHRGASLLWKVQWWPLYTRGRYAHPESHANATLQGPGFNLGDGSLLACGCHGLTQISHWPGGEVLGRFLRQMLSAVLLEPASTVSPP